MCVTASQYCITDLKTLTVKKACDDQGSFLQDYLEILKRILKKCLLGTDSVRYTLSEYQ